MALPQEPNETLKRLDIDILAYSPVALYFKTEIFKQDLSWFEKNNYQIFKLNASEWLDEVDFHKDIARKMDFPGYYGENLDALNDCLRDVSFQGIAGIVVAFEHFDFFFKKFEYAAWAILDIISDHSRCRLLSNHKLIALVQSDDPRIQIKPVGASTPMWNTREWHAKNRELS
jgi:RNAse (barnase) inhibitor barstar